MRNFFPMKTHRFAGLDDFTVAPCCAVNGCKQIFRPCSAQVLTWNSAATN
jgi:hypothetical protein